MSPVYLVNAVSKNAGCTALWPGRQPSTSWFWLGQTWVLDMLFHSLWWALCLPKVPPGKPSLASKEMAECFLSWNQQEPGWGACFGPDPTNARRKLNCFGATHQEWGKFCHWLLGKHLNKKLLIIAQNYLKASKIVTNGIAMIFWI